LTGVESEGFVAAIIIAQSSEQGAAERRWRGRESTRGHRGRGLLGAVDVSWDGIESRSSMNRADILRFAFVEHAAEGETHEKCRGKDSNRGTKWNYLQESIELIVNIQHNYLVMLNIH
jgi:hypothetical protein